MRTVGLVPALHDEAAAREVGCVSEYEPRWRAIAAVRRCEREGRRPAAEPIPRSALYLDLRSAQGRALVARIRLAK